MTMPQVINRAARVALALAVTGCLAACASAPKTDAQKQADRLTAERVEAALNADKQLYAAHITVRADNGVVRLSGYVWDPADIIDAKETAELVEGVRRVVNNLELQQNGIDNSPVSR